MKKLIPRLTIVCLCAIALSLMFIAAIPGLVISAQKNTVWLMVVCISVLGVGLPAIPLLWVYFAKLYSLQPITATVEDDRIYEINVIVARLHLTRKTVMRRLRRILRWHILREYYMDEKFIRPTYHLGAQSILHCDHCGANFDMAEGADVCPHCGAAQKK